MSPMTIASRCVAGPSVLYAASAPDDWKYATIASTTPSTISTPPMNIQQPVASGARVAQPHVGDVGAELGRRRSLAPGSLAVGLLPASGS